MCGRFGILVDYSQAAREFRARPAFQFRPSYNIYPGQKIPAVVDKSGERVMEGFTWGMIPAWGKSKEKGKKQYFMINARAETIETKQAFRDSFHSQRCLIPASGFYEWKKEASGKTPFYITLKDRSLFAFAGIWGSSRTREGESMNATIITTSPNELMGKIHDRMPMIMLTHKESAWLDPASEPEKLKSMLVPYPSQDMEAHEVSRLVNNPRMDGPELIRPVKAAGLRRFTE